MNNRLKKLRKEKNMTVRELEEKTKIGFSVISKIELGKSSLNQDYLITLSKFFNVSADYLLGLSNERNPVKELQTNTKTIINYTPLQQTIINKLLKLNDDDLYMLEGMIDNLLERQAPMQRKVE